MSWNRGGRGQRGGGGGGGGGYGGPRGGHGHYGGGGGGNEMRRPHMGGGAEDLARGMEQMQPFQNGENLVLSSDTLMLQILTLISRFVAYFGVSS